MLLPSLLPPQGPPAVPGGGRGTDGGQVGKVQDPEMLSQELEASLTRCVSGRA